MAEQSPEWIDELIEQQQSGYSLDQAFYRDPEIFKRDVQRLISRHWMMAGHVSQVANEGDYFLFEVAGESIIIIRGKGDAIHAHYNVCRHRGSLVVLDCEGNSRNLTCRYHGWTYACDGRLKAAASMPADFKPSEHGLMPCHVQVVSGLILVALTVDAAPDLQPVVETLSPFLDLHGIESARLARRQTFPVKANWKLALENYLECYHCKPAHPQYSKIEIKVEKSGDGSPAAMQRYQQRYQAWRSEAERLDTWIEDASIELPLDERLPQTQLCSAYRAPLRSQYCSATEDGKPAAPLMGQFKEYDGGETAVGIGPFSYMLAANDHAVFFQFVPRDAEHSDMIISWLVAADAIEGKDYDLDHLCWLWTVTTEQDKAIIEANRAGVYSSRYQPGPASLLEADLTGFRNWYLALIGPPDRLRQLKPAGTGRYFGF